MIMLDDVALVAKIMEGEANPDWSEHAEELGERAVKGSPMCRSVSLKLLRAMWDAGAIPTCEYITKVELFALPGARNADEESMLCLAGVWSLRAIKLREAGFLEDAHRIEVEAIIMIGRLANGNSDAAVVHFNEMRAHMPEAAVQEAEGQLWLDGLTVEPRPEPETVKAQDLQDARREAAAKFWGWSADDDTPPTTH